MLGQQSGKRPASSNLRGMVERRVAGKSNPMDVSDAAADEHWAENVLRWTGKRPTPAEVTERKLQRVDKSKRTETSQPSGLEGVQHEHDVQVPVASEDVRMTHKRVREEEQEMEDMLARSRSLDGMDSEEFLARISGKDPRLVATVATSGPPWHDEYTGLELSPEQVTAAMAKEMSSHESFGVAEWVRESEAEGYDIELPMALEAAAHRRESAIGRPTIQHGRQARHVCGDSDHYWSEALARAGHVLRLAIAVGRCEHHILACVAAGTCVRAATGQLAPAGLVVASSPCPVRTATESTRVPGVPCGRHGAAWVHALGG